MDLRGKKSFKIIIFLVVCVFMPLSALADTWQGSWMWYPGQLAAFRQAKQKAMSEARCVNVGYPGKYFEPQTVCWFRAKTNKKADDLHLKASGEATFTQGKNYIVVKVGTANGVLPSMIVDDRQLGEASKWSVSLDGKTWNLAESDSRGNNPNVLPDDDKEIVVTVDAASAVALRKCSITNDADGKPTSMVLGNNGAVLVDFNTIELGNVAMTVRGHGKLHFTAGESQEEAMNENQKYNEQTELPTVALDGSTQHITLPVYALRYLKIRATDTCKVTDVVFNTLMWPVEQQLTFECNDPRINNLFNAGIATLKTSLHNFYLDGVKRDFLPWAMDAMVSSLGADYAFGDQQVTRNCISIALMKPNPTAEDFGVVDYPLHALIGLEEEYKRYGDLRTSLMFRDRIEQQLKLYESQLDDKGFLEAKEPTWGFIPGWNLQNGPSKYGTAAYAQMLLYLDFKIAAKFEKRWGDNNAAKYYGQLAKTLGDKIKASFWDDSRHAFINGFDNSGNIDTRISHQAQIAAVIAGLYPEKYYDELFDNILPKLPHYYDDVSYEKGYDALAYTKAGKTRELFTLLDKVWGRWLDQGYIRYPENFMPEASLSEQQAFYGRPFGLSLCHGANGVPPVLAILKGIFGFSVAEDGTYTFAPDLMDLQWAKGRIPTPHGYITITLNKDGSNAISAPKGCKYRITSPYSYMQKRNKRGE